jgi:hypothetical protein
MEIPNNAEESGIIRSLPTVFEELTKYMNSKFIEGSQLLNEFANQAIQFNSERIMNKMIEMDTLNQSQREK